MTPLKYQLFYRRAILFGGGVLWARLFADVPKKESFGRSRVRPIFSNVSINCLCDSAAILMAKYNGVVTTAIATQL